MSLEIKDCIGKAIEAVEADEHIATVRFSDGSTLELSVGSTEYGWLNVCFPHEVEDLVGQRIAGVDEGQTWLYIKLEDGSEFDFTASSSEEGWLNSSFTP